MAGDMQLKLQLNLDSKQYTAALLAAGQQVQQFSGQLQTADTAAQAMANALRAAATAAICLSLIHISEPTRPY